MIKNLWWMPLPSPPT